MSKLAADVKQMRARLVKVDPEEYAALCELRDGAYETLKLRAMRLQGHYEECLATNREQAARLARQDMEVQSTRALLARREAECLRLRAKIAELESTVVNDMHRR